MPEQPLPKETATPPVEHSTGARVLVAGAFAALGGKIGTLGLIADANAAFAGEKLTFGEKFRGVFNGTLKNQLQSQYEILTKIQNKNMLTAAIKLTKYSTALSAITMVAGGILGWARGGRIQNWREIKEHPWESTKIILGIEKSAEEYQAETKSAVADTTKERSQRGKTWAESVEARQQQPQVAEHTL